MLLEGSCHCGQIRFAVESPHPYPFNRCYCGVCRKTTGGGGYAINLGAQADSLEILEGQDQLRVYQAATSRRPDAPKSSHAKRHFCGVCGSQLWLFDDRWPELIHPLASAIDTPLPEPPEHTHMMLGSKANWVPMQAEPQDRQHKGYPEESLAGWHARLGVVDD